MLRSFTTKELIFIALVGALLAVVDFIISAGVSVATGIPGSGYILASFFFVLIATVGGLVVRKFGAFTVMAFIYGVIAGLTTSFGLPWIHTVWLCVVTGLFADIVVWIFRFRNSSYIFSLSLGNVFMLPPYVYLFKVLGLPGADKLIEYIWWMALFYFVTGLIGASVGIYVYKKKFCKMNIVKQISGGKR